MSTQTTLNFVTSANEEVRFVLDNHWSGTGQKAVEIAFADFREGPLPTLPDDGFTLAHVDCDVTDYDDQQQLEDVWFTCVKETILQATGARWATLFAGPLRRFSNNSSRATESAVSAPARAVHADLHAGFGFFDIGAQPVAERAAAEARDEFGERPPDRWRVFNFWQMLSPPPQDNSLALCRLSSVDDADVIAGKGLFDIPGTPAAQALANRRDSHDFDITFFRHNPRQQWGYFSDMQPGDALIFSTFDPQAGALAARVPHASIDLGAGSTPPVPRHSIEIRALVAY